MSHVSVTINGRQFRMACDDGQEDHLYRLAATVNSKIDQLKGSFGEIGDTRLTVMAAIMVADDMAETQRRIKALEDEVAALREARNSATERLESRERAFVQAISQTAERLERVTARLTTTKSEG